MLEVANVNFVNGLDKERVEVNIKILENLVESTSLNKQVQDLKLALDASYMQQEAYGDSQRDEECSGVKKWHKDFSQLVKILPENYETQAQTSLNKAQVLRIKHMQELFYAMPHKARVFQELFSEPGEFSVSNDPSNMTTQSYVLGSIVSLRLLPEELVKNLALCDFSNCVGKPYERLEKMADKNVITALKLIFLGMTPIDGATWGDGKKARGEKARVFILNPVHSQDADVNKILEEYNKKCVGKLAMISTLGATNEMLSSKKVKGFRVHRKKISVIDDIYGAHRAFVNIEKGYEEESKKILNLQNGIEFASEKLNSWTKQTDPAIKEKIQEELITLCNQSKENFSKIQNVHKKEALNFFNGILECVSVQTNPRANVMQLVAAYNRLSKRFKEFNSIQMYEGKDARTLINLIRSARNSFDIVSDIVNRIDERISSQNQITSQDKEQIEYELGACISSFYKFTFSPYRQLAEKVKSTFADMQSKLNDEEGYDVIKKDIRKIKYYLYLENNVIRNINAALKVDATVADINVAIERIISGTLKMLDKSTYEDEKKALENIYNEANSLRDKIDEKIIESSPNMRKINAIRDFVKDFLDKVMEQF